MYLAYFDCGTSNTRLYLIRGRKPVDLLQAAEGSRDTAMGGEGHAFAARMARLYGEMLERHGLCDADVEGVYCSGMAGSPFGLCEAPHLEIPAGAERFHDTMVPYFEERYFKREIRVIRGLRTPGVIHTLDGLADVSNVRGEEVELLGVLQNLDAEKRRNVAVLFPGSHTQCFFVENGEIVGLLSTVSGELAHAITAETILGASVRWSETPMDTDMVCRGADSVREYGFARAVYMIHASRVFHLADDEKRRDMLEGVIAGSVADAFVKRLARYPAIGHVVVAASKAYMRCYALVLNRFAPGISTETIMEQKPESFAVQGFLNIYWRE